MPAVLLHLTVARQARERASATDAGVDAELLDAIGAHDDALLLGAALPDLPYYARFPLQMTRHLLKLGYRHSEWGDVLHTRYTGRLAYALVAHLRRAQLGGEARARVLALCCGYLCHIALDTAVHPAINDVVAADTRDELTDVVHSEAERFQSLLYHHRLRGEDVTGTPYPREMMGGIAGTSLLRPRLDPPLWTALRSALLETHGRTPGSRQLGDWLWGIAVYGNLIASPAGRKTQGLGDGDVAALARQRLQGPDIDLLTPIQRGIERTLSHWRYAAAALRSERWDEAARQAFLDGVPDADLDLGYL